MNAVLYFLGWLGEVIIEWVLSIFSPSNLWGAFLTVLILYLSYLLFSNSFSLTLSWDEDRVFEKSVKETVDVQLSVTGIYNNGSGSVSLHHSNDQDIYAIMSFQTNNHGPVYWENQNNDNYVRVDFPITITKSNNFNGSNGKEEIVEPPPSEIYLYAKKYIASEFQKLEGQIIALPDGIVLMLIKFQLGESSVCVIGSHLPNNTSHERIIDVLNSCRIGRSDIRVFHEFDFLFWVTNQPQLFQDKPFFSTMKMMKEMSQIMGVPVFDPRKLILKQNLDCTLFFSTLPDRNVKQMRGKFQKWTKPNKALNMLEADFTVSVVNSTRETKKYEIVILDLKLVSSKNYTPGVYVAITGPFLDPSRTFCSALSRLQPQWTQKEIPLIRCNYVSNARLVSSVSLTVLQYNEDGKDVLIGESLLPLSNAKNKNQQYSFKIPLISATFTAQEFLQGKIHIHEIDSTIPSCTLCS